MEKTFNFNYCDLRSDPEYFQQYRGTKALVGASFRASKVQGVNFAGLDLTDADFNDAHISGADFTGATLRRQALARAWYPDEAKVRSVNWLKGPMPYRPHEPDAIERDEVITRVFRRTVTLRRKWASRPPVVTTATPTHTNDVPRTDGDR